MRAFLLVIVSRSSSSLLGFLSCAAQALKLCASHDSGRHERKVCAVRRLEVTGEHTSLDGYYPFTYYASHYIRVRMSLT
jgi:hypothetical protein